jgi:hypothetical protein
MKLYEIWYFLRLVWERRDEVRAWGERRKVEKQQLKAERLNAIEQAFNREVAK